MRKSFKKLSSVFAFAVVAATLGLFASCGDTDEPIKPDITPTPDPGGDDNPGLSTDETFVFEFEDLDFSDKSSSGLSGAAAGWELVSKATGFGINVPEGTEASNGYFAGYTYEAGFTYEFEITASEATEAEMTLRMNSEIGTFELGPDHGLAIIVNGQVLDYSSVTVTVGKDVNGVDSLYAFKDYKISVPVSLNDGKNTIIFEILPATVSRGQIAPLMDCMKLVVKDSVTLTFANNYQEETGRGYEAD